MTETREGTDVVERLTEWVRAHGGRESHGFIRPIGLDDVADALDELTSLRAENEALKEALRPFFDGFSYDPGHSDLDNEQPISVRVQLGDWRRARRVLAALSKATGGSHEQG